MSIEDVAADFGKGLFAGLAGTAAMTVSSTLEMKLSGRAASETPAQAAEKVLKVEPEDAQSEGQFSNLVHWGYGTGWGGAGASGFRRALRPRRYGRSPRPGLGLGAGCSPRARRLGSGLQVWWKGGRHGPVAPRRLRHGHRARLLVPGSEPVLKSLTG